jgi:hypothetical protein
MGTAVTQRGSGAHLNAFDFRTGAALYRAHTGLRLGNDNHGAPVTIGPDRTSYIGSIRGLLAVRDR